MVLFVRRAFAQTGAYIIANLCFKPLSRKSTSMLANRRGFEFVSVLLKEVHSRQQTFDRLFRKKNSRRLSATRFERHHGLEHAAPAISDHGASTRLRLQWHDAKILLAGKNQSLT